MKKQTYFAILTAEGKAKFALALEHKTTIKLSSIALGDGNSDVPTLDRERSILINERCRAPLNTLSVNPDNIYQLIAEQIFPANEDSSWIREIGLFDDEGELFALASHLPTDQPKLSEHTGDAQLIRVVLNVPAPRVIELKMGDPGNILATHKYVNEYVQEAVQQAHEQSDKRYWHRDEKLFPDRQSGYQILPSGLLLQWGVAEIQPGRGDIVSNQVSFPISFPNEVLSIQCTEDGTGGSGNACSFFLYRKIDNTKFLVRSDWVAQRYSFISCSWLALGY